MPHTRGCPRVRSLVILAASCVAGFAANKEPGLLFYLSADHGTTADVAAPGTAEPTFVAEVTPITDGAKGGALECGDYQRLAYRAPGNIYAQRGTLSFFWRSRYPVGPTEFPVFRVAYADHSSWDMVWLRIDYNGHGFDAFVTDINLARTRVSVTLPKFPAPNEWTHLALSWDETRGIRFYVDGRLADKVETTADYDAALDQFGPHSRIISPYQVQSDYNFTRGGDIDEVRIYGTMLDDEAVAGLAGGEATKDKYYRLHSLADAEVRAHWLHRYGWDRGAPPALPAEKTSVRKVEISDAFDLKRWWWKATDGIPETTWPGVYNRSRLPGRHDYFTLPDWDCYVDSGKAITFALPDEPWNHLEITGAAWGKMELLPAGTKMETASEARAEAVLFERAKGQAATSHELAQPLTGRQIRFTNAAQETPIGEISAYNVTAGTEPAGVDKLAYRIVPSGRPDPSLASLREFVTGRYSPDERAINVAQPADLPLPDLAYLKMAKLPLVNVLIPNKWDERTDGLDGIAIDLPAFKYQTGADGLIAFNIRVKDPLWPMRDLLNFSFSVKPGAAHTLWLDLRDRLLPAGRGLFFSIASNHPGFDELSLLGANLRLVFKSREAARPEHELDRFTQARDSYAMLVEEHPTGPKLNLWVRFKQDLEDLLRVNPGHVLGQQYAAAAGLSGGQRPAFTQPAAPAGVPLWALRQTHLLGQVQHFVDFYIDHRQSAYGDFGGGISDDVDLLNTWPGVALMGVEPDKINGSLHRLLEAAFTNGMFTNGLPTIQADELHSYEEGINCLAQNLIANFGSPRQIERAMATARGVESITGINAAGHRHIRTSYYSGTRMAVEDPWGWSKPYSYLVCQVPQLLVEYNGNPAAKKIQLELTDGLLAHRRAEASGRPMLPTSIHFTDDREGDYGRGYFPWHMFWAAWQYTGDQKYLAPIVENNSALAINANAMDLLDLRADWAAQNTPPEVGGRRNPNATSRPAPGGRASAFRSSVNEHFAWQVDGDKTRLERLYAAQIENCAVNEYIETEGSLWIDRVGVPTAELQRARLGGVALLRGSLYPGHAVSWTFAAPAKAQDVAILIPDATRTAFNVIAYNLSSAPITADLTGWNVDPGVWEITQGVDTNNDDVADGTLATRTAPFERSRSVTLTLAPRVATILTFKRVAPGTPYWSRPDLGIDPEDVVVRGREVQVTVHSLGSVPSPGGVVVLRDRSGVEINTEITSLPAPLDLMPKTATVTVNLQKEKFDLHGFSVEIRQEGALGEITMRNNAVTLR